MSDTSETEAQTKTNTPPDGHSSITDDIAKTCGISQRQAAIYLRTVADILKKSLQEGRSVTIRGFGRFTVVDRKGFWIKRPMPYAGKMYGEPTLDWIPDRKAIKFTPHPSLKRMVNDEYLGSDPLPPDDYKRPAERNSAGKHD